MIEKNNIKETGKIRPEVDVLNADNNKKVEPPWIWEVQVDTDVEQVLW